MREIAIVFLFYTYLNTVRGLLCYVCNEIKNQHCPVNLEEMPQARCKGNDSHCVAIATEIDEKYRIQKFCSDSREDAEAKCKEIENLMRTGVAADVSCYHCVSDLCNSSIKLYPLFLTLFLACIFAFLQ